MAKILITGGTGMVGKALSGKLLAAGHEVALLSRKPKPSGTKGLTEYHWELAKGYIDPKAMEHLDHVVHLAGAGIADQRWTEERKKELIASRVNSMALLEREILKHHLQLKSFTGASAVGYYGMVTAPFIFTEGDKPATSDFLVQCCTAWEQSYANVPSYAAKHAVIRLGVVLGKDGGALKKMLPLARLGLGSPLGSGQQYMPWLQLEDAAEIFCQSLFNPSMQGTYNAAAPESLTNLEFSKALAHVLHRPFFAPHVPAFALKMLYGEMAGVVLEGSRVSCGKLLSTGFRFRFGKVEQALKAELA